MERKVRGNNLGAPATMAFLLLAASLLNTLLAGCALLPQDTVAFQTDRQLTEMFESAEVPPGYSYYYFGSEAAPTAILGIAPPYRLQQGLWKKIDLSRERLRAWTEYLDVRYRRGPYYYAASKIIDRDGNTVGIWYSYHLWTTVRVNPDGTVAVFPPDEVQFKRLHPPFRGPFN